MKRQCGPKASPGARARSALPPEAHGAPSFLRWGLSAHVTSSGVKQLPYHPLCPLILLSFLHGRNHRLTYDVFISGHWSNQSREEGTSITPGA